MKKFLLFSCTMFICIKAFGESFTIDWYNGDNITSTTCSPGYDIVLPTTPTKQGYDFTGWESLVFLEHIQATGTQFFRTDIYLDQDIEIESEWQRTDINNINFLYGVYDSNQTNTFTAYHGTGLTSNWRFSSDAISFDTRDTNWHHTIQNKNGVDVDGTFYPYTNIQNFRTTEPMYVFTAINQTTGNISYRARAKLKYLTVRKNGNIIWNGVPAKRQSDNEIGLYDTISSEFFVSEGSNRFIGGPEK